MRVLHAIWLLLSIVLLSIGSARAIPNITTEPYKHFADNSTAPLSQDPANPTLFTWGEDETIRWWAFSSSAENGLPSSTWHVVPASEGQSEFPAGFCTGGPVRFCADPQQELQANDYEFWITATDDEGSVDSERYYIRMTFPPIVPTDYFPVAPEFLGKLARAERTGFNFGAIAHGIADTPEISGCDNPSMFYGLGRLNFIFGDPNVYTEDPSTGSRGLNGALAFTDSIVPEKGFDLSHHRNWVMDPETRTAKGIIDRAPGTSRANNTGGAILPLEDGGHRLWFAVYDYGSGPRPSYRNYYRVAIVYSDDEFATPAVREESLILWEKDDPANGPNDPDPYLGYHMRLFKDHLYMMIPREGGSDPVLLRCHVDDLDKLSLDHWHYLVGVDAQGNATWSAGGITRGQISHADFPTVDFEGNPPNIITSSTWNPYLNRWVAFPALGNRIWTARQLWGPYEDLATPQFFSMEQFAQYYALFGHELLLAGNGEWIHHAQARSWQPLGYYGTYNQRLQLRDKLKLSVTPKTGIAGDTITIVATNDTGLDAPPPENVSVSVDGNPASFVSQDGDHYTFTYEITGGENGGGVGLIDVSGVMDVPFTHGSSYRATRDVAFVVNHRNALTASVRAPAQGGTVSGWVAVDVDAGYALGSEELLAHQPEVKILKVELRHVDAGGEEVLDADVEAPYTLRFDSRRLADGEQSFKVIAYGTLDRRAVETLTLDLQNGPGMPVAFNLVPDGDMESSNTSAWTALSGAELSKIGGIRHRHGRRSLHLRSETPSSWAGIRQVFTGLSGGERLRLTGWARLLNNYTAQFRWILRDQGGATLASHYASSYGYFRRVRHEFVNPEGNTEIMLDALIRDTGPEGVIAGTPVTAVEALVDDIVLRPSCHQLVTGPSDVQATPGPMGETVRVSWTPSADENVLRYAVFRREIDAELGEWIEIGETKPWVSQFLDENLPGPAGSFEYEVRARDGMGSTSVDVALLGEISNVRAGAPPLRILDSSESALVVEADPDALAYNVYADTLGSWYSPTAAEGSACSLASWTENGDGTITLDYDVPENSWIVVTASDACGEGSAGLASDGSERFTSGSWPACGPVVD